MHSRPRLRVCSLAFLFLLATQLAPAVSRAQSEDGSEGAAVLRSANIVRSLVAHRSATLRASAGPDPDTVYVGKSFSDHTAPDNYWNLYVGQYRPGVNAPDNAMWDWDNTAGTQAADSLQGWWPIHRQYVVHGGRTLTDDRRPWWALDHGNIANYVISQQSSAKRTFGVVGIWHADPGNTAGNGVMWSPLAGSKSAWCGLRQHADNTVKDAVTGQSFNQNTVFGLHEATVAGGGSPNRFPGYPDQIDQMLYRDIAMTSTQSLTVAFKYRTRMSTSIDMNALTRAGWFHGDPLWVTAGNFISSSAADTLAPRDSFMVYVGAPVDDQACVYSDGLTRPVYDKQRRWFSEVLRVFGAGSVYFEVFKAAGNNPADTLSATPSASVTVPAASVASILSPATSGSVRLVFRCKTNRGFSDSDSRNSGYTSFGRGAVLIDDVSVDTGAGAVVIGDFEGSEQGGVNQIDNRFPLPPGLAVADVWRSTGKPPGEYFHVESLSSLTYNDVCGPPGSPARLCNIGGVVVSMGNHDDGERVGDRQATAFSEITHSLLSPTINLLEAAPGVPNSQGITASIAQATDDVVLWYDIYAGMFNMMYSGSMWTSGSQCYPATQPNGAKCWGQLNYPGNNWFAPEPVCFTNWQGFNTAGMPFKTSNASGIPDSLRVFIVHTQLCFKFAVTLGCNSNEGGYIDNVSVAFIDLPAVPGQASASTTVSLGAVQSSYWEFVNDTFPANETAGMPGTSDFDTTTALIRSGTNKAQTSSAAQVTGIGARFAIPGDSSIVSAPNATVGVSDDPALAQVRVDMVFRILPGPGNYQVAAGRFMPPGGTPTGTLLQVPTNQTAVVTPGDPSYWGQLIADPGEFSAGDHNGHTRWDPLTWNSVRMDTCQVNIFQTKTFVGTGLFAGRYMTTIHELDPRFLTLGVDKFKCFLVDTSKAASSTPALNNVSCNGSLPAWLTTVPRSRTGWDGSATTKEFTKIIPDGLLTPGSHVQYFYRKSHAVSPTLDYAMCPDTNAITPQPREGSVDQHRWQQFSVLPDRWKSNVFGGSGAACMLYVDLHDRYGSEPVFVSVMDSIGGTAAAKWGAHNGWHAPGTTNVSGLDVRSDMSVAVSNQNSQPGTTWDMYGVKMSGEAMMAAGSLGSRLANRSNMGFAAGRESRQGPTGEMLRTYYRMVSILTGDLTGAAGILGPVVDGSQNDVALLNDYLTGASGSARPRGLLVQGANFVNAEKTAGACEISHSKFITDKLGVVLRDGHYDRLSGNLNECADLLTTTNLTSSADVYGLTNKCNSWTFWTPNDVLSLNPAIPEAVVGSFYENVGVNGPYIAEVVKPATALRDWIAVTSGYCPMTLMSRYCESSSGRLAYYYSMLNTVFGGICQLTGAPVVTLDTPQGTRAGAYANFMKVGNSVMRLGSSSVRLGVAKAGRVQVHLYDVAGRKVRTLTDRVFPAGEHALSWDGTDDSGQKLPRGVYFVRSSQDADAKRIIVLNN